MELSTVQTPPERQERESHLREDLLFCITMDGVFDRSLVVYNGVIEGGLF